MGKSSRPKFIIDTYEKARAVLDAKSYRRGAIEALKYMFELYPELSRCTHEHIGEVMLFERETVTRAMNRLKQQGLIPALAAMLLFAFFSTAQAATHVLSSIATGTTYFACTWYYSDGSESGFSNEIEEYIDDGVRELSCVKPRGSSEYYALNGISGYKLYWGTATGDYGNTLDIRYGGELVRAGAGQPASVRSGAGVTLMRVVP